MNASANETAATNEDWSAARYERHARFVSDYGAAVVDWLDPQPGERILDLGCGDGALTAVIAERGAQVRGLDRSPAFVEAARERGIDARVGDAQAKDWARDWASDETAGYDAVFSNAALHWMGRAPQAVIDGVAQVLVPGGRFVAEFGAHGNVAPVHAALRAECEARGLDADALDPWYFPDDKEYRNQLESAGFSIKRQVMFERPTPLPGDMGDWLLTLAGPFVNAVPAGEEREAFVAAVRERLVDDLRLPDGRWVVPYVRLRFDARKAS